MNSKLLTCLVALVLALMVAGCGDDKNDTATDGANQTTETTEPTDSTAEAPAEPDDSASEEEGKPPKVSGSLKKKPEIATPAGSPPTELVSKDVKKGKGKKATDGDKVSVQYVGLNWSNGVEFDASWGRGQPFEFELGAGGVIKGWDQGVKGMRVGGRRLLVIPPDLGYGPAGSPPSIPPDETLVFVVDLTKVK